MATNVVLRYLFSYGSVWAQELEWHLLAPLILFGIPYALLKGEHVRVDVLYAKFTRAQPASRGRRLRRCSASLISAAFVWLSFKYVQQSYVIDEKSADPGGLPHRWVLKALIPAGLRAARAAEPRDAAGRGREAARAAGRPMSGQESSPSSCWQRSSCCSWRACRWRSRSAPWASCSASWASARGSSTCCPRASTAWWPTTSGSRSRSSSSWA